MKKYPCRCKECRARRTLAQHPDEYPDEYRRAPLCPCGGVYRVDTYRRTTEHRKAACYCSGFPWEIDGAGHRRGSTSPANGWACYESTSKSLQ